MTQPQSGLPHPGRGYVIADWHGQMSWNGVVILARRAEPMETRRGLPHDPADTHSRYIEAAIGGVVVGCLYLPNGNPAPGPKFAFARDAGLRIDHLLLSPAIAGRLVAAKVDRDVRGCERTSDHAPVWIQLAEAKSRSSRRRRERGA